MYRCANCPKKRRCISPENLENAPEHLKKVWEQRRREAERLGVTQDSPNETYNEIPIPKNAPEHLKKVWEQREKEARERGFR